MSEPRILKSVSVKLTIVKKAAPPPPLEVRGGGGALSVSVSFDHGSAASCPHTRRHCSSACAPRSSTYGPLALPIAHCQPCPLQSAANIRLCTVARLQSLIRHRRVGVEGGADHLHAHQQCRCHHLRGCPASGRISHCRLQPRLLGGFLHDPSSSDPRVHAWQVSLVREASVEVDSILGLGLVGDGHASRDQELD